MGIADGGIPLWAVHLQSWQAGQGWAWRGRWAAVCVLTDDALGSLPLRKRGPVPGCCLGLDAAMAEKRKVLLTTGDWYVPWMYRKALAAA